MSLLDLLKDKPPVVPVGDVPWPSPARSVVTSSPAAPFLTSSPLFSAKRTPTLREFLNPNYRERREDQNSDVISEPSDLLLAIENCKSSSTFSKSDLALQRSSRSKASKQLLSNLGNQSVETHPEKKLAKGTDKITFAMVTKDEKLDHGCLESEKKTKMLSNASTTKKDDVEKQISQTVNNSDTFAGFNVDNSEITNTSPRMMLGPNIINVKEKTEDAISQEMTISDNITDTGICDSKSITTSPGIILGTNMKSTKESNKNEILRGMGKSDTTTNINVCSSKSTDTNPGITLASNIVSVVKENTENEMSQGMTISKTFTSSNVFISESGAASPEISLDSNVACDVKEQESIVSVNKTNNDSSISEDKLSVMKRQSSEIESFIDDEDLLRKEKRVSVAPQGLTTQSDSHNTCIAINVPTTKDENQTKRDCQDSTGKASEEQTIPLESLQKGAEENTKVLSVTDLKKACTVVDLTNSFEDPLSNIQLVSKTTNSSINISGLHNTSRHKENIQFNSAEGIDSTISPNVASKISSGNISDISRVIPAINSFQEYTCISLDGSKIKDKSIISPNITSLASKVNSCNSKSCLLKDSFTPAHNSHQENLLLESTESINNSISSNATFLSSRVNSNNIKSGLSNNNLSTDLHQRNVTLDSTESSDSSDSSDISDISISPKISSLASTAAVNHDAITSHSDSEDTSSIENDFQDDSEVQVDEDFVEVLVFKDSDDSDDDDDGLEDGEIDWESSDDNCKPEENPEILSNDPSSECKEINTGEEESVSLTKLQNHKKKKRRKRKKIFNQGGGSKRRKYVPQKKKKDMCTIPKKKKLEKPVNEDIIKSEPKNKEPIEEIHSQEEFSLLSTITNNVVMDVTIAASEKELIKKKTRGGKASAKKRKKIQKRMNDYLARRNEKRRQRIVMEPLPMPLCAFYLRGSCNKGDECQFRHEGTPIKNPQLCKYYVMGACEKGDNCLYQHRTYPCRFFHLGQRLCQYGNRCKFSHDAPTPETKVLFDQLYADEKSKEDGLLSNLSNAAQEKEKPIDRAVNYQNTTKKSTNTDTTVSSNAVDNPCLYNLRNRSVQKTAYSVRYGSVHEQENCSWEQSCEGTQEKDKTVKGSRVGEGKDQENNSCLTSKPSYVVPGMYTK